jgi:hypothetical protein
MSPRLPLLVLLLLLPCGLAAADPGATDSVSTPADTPSVAPVALHPPLEGLVRADRVAHASLGLALGVGVGLASREPAVGTGTTLALAVAKELLDDRFDRGDLAAGALGAGLAWLVVAALTR